MKRIILFFLLISFSISLNGQVRSKVTFIPEKPKIGDSLTILFTPGLNSPLLKESSVNLQMYLYDAKTHLVPAEYAMKRRGDSWIYTIKLDNPKTVYILLQIGGTKFKVYDTNEGKAWGVKIYNNEGNPVRGAYKAEGNTYMVHGIIWRMQNPEEYDKGYKKEYELYPDAPEKIIDTWNSRFRLSSNPDSTKKIIIREADEILKQYPDDRDIKYSLYFTINRIDSTMSKQFKNGINESALLKRINLHNEWNKNIFMGNGEERLKTYYEYYQKAKGTSYEQDAAIEYYRSMIRANYFKQALQFLDEWNKPYVFDIIMSGGQILSACEKELNKTLNKEVTNSIDLNEQKAKTDELLMDAKALMYKMILLYERDAPQQKFNDFFPSSSKGEMERGKGYAYQNAGKADFLIKDYNSAIENFQKAIGLLGDRGYYPSSISAYIKSLYETGKYEEAFTVGYKTFMQYNWDNYKELKGIMVAASKFLDKNICSKKLEEIEEHKKVLRQTGGSSEPFPDFKNVPALSLTDIAGKKYALQTLAGKIIIIQFWSTTGNWSETTAPAFNEFCKKHMNDKDLAILSVNSDLLQGKSNRKNIISEFVKSNKWNFPVILDNKNEILDKFVLEELPCTVFVGPDGKVYYYDSGTPGKDLISRFEKYIEMINKDIK